MIFAMETYKYYIFCEYLCVFVCVCVCVIVCVCVCVCVCKTLFTQHVMRMRHIFIFALSGCTTSFRIIT
jgi:hypothetical protein